MTDPEAVENARANEALEKEASARGAGCYDALGQTAFGSNGAAQESNLPSRGLHDRTGFEDRLGHRAHAAP